MARTPPLSGPRHEYGAAKPPKSPWSLWSGCLVRTGVHRSRSGPAAVADALRARMRRGALPGLPCGQNLPMTGISCTSFEPVNIGSADSSFCSSRCGCGRGTDAAHKEAGGRLVLLGKRVRDVVIAGHPRGRGEITD